MTSPTPNMASGALGHADAHESEAAAAADAGPFVLNLCSSTTPMALAQADLEELKRFTFFVSRRFEEGRERFRLHMGYFTSLAEAEQWLNVVRDIYPGAWAGEAPGKKLRAKAAAANAVQAAHAQGPQPRSALPNRPAPAPTAPQAAAPARPAAARPVPIAHAPAAPVAARPVDLKQPAPAPRAPAAPPPTVYVEPPAIIVPTVHAAAPVAPPRPAAPPVLAPPVAKAAAPVRSIAPVAAKVAPPPLAKFAPSAQAARGHSSAVHPAKAATTAVPTAVQSMTGLKAAPTLRAEAPQPAPRAPVKSAAPVVSAPPKQRPKAAGKGNPFDESNVRDVLAALDDTSETGETRMMPAPQIPHIEAQDDGLTDTQVLRYLENRRNDDGSGRSSEDQPDASISLLKPDDTQTRRALKEAVSTNASVSFAVQLQWAVQPVELDKVPPLAIFSAYTLYTVEGSREGRKWYGLRLGFFSDAISAKQVAYYVRSEFASVAVVPVSPQEKQRASDEDKKANAALAFPRKTRQGPVDEFKLLDSDDGEGAKPAAKGAKPGAVAAKPVARAPVPQPASVKRAAAVAGKGGRINARDRKGPQTLEETLEILGASELEIDGGRGESINDTGVRHLRVEVQKNTPFSRLLERLSERTKKN